MIKMSKEQVMERPVTLDRRVERFLSDDGPKKLYVGGDFMESVAGRMFDTINPATEEKITSVYESDQEDVEVAVQAAERALHGEWSRLTASERGQVLWKLADLMEEHLEPLAQLEALDNGKTVTHARAADLPLSIDHFRYYAGWATKVTGEVIDNSSGKNMLTYTRREPVGVVGQIIPWNFPILMLA